MAASDSTGRRASQGGFTLLEALVAIAILAMVTTYFLGMRTAALIDAQETRNWRIAREIAEHHLSEMKAGAREMPPESGREHKADGYDDFRYRIVIGEAAVAGLESELASIEAEYAPEGSHSGSRLAWQQERDRLRRVQASGMTMLDYEDSLLEKEFEEVIPSEEEFEEVAVIVTFPNIRPSEQEGAEHLSFVLKAKISTMAIQGLTPDRAKMVAEMRGGDTDEDTVTVDSFGGE